MSVFETIGDFLDDHKSEIAFGLGIVLTGATTVFAVKATPKAISSISEEEVKRGRELTKWEKVKVGWKHYIVPIATESLGLACLFFGKNVDLKATNAAMVAAEASQKLLKTYSGKVIEEIGEKKEEEIRKAVVSDQTKRVPIIKGSEDAYVMDGDSWFYDPLFGKKFVSSEIKIRSALNAFNEKMIADDSASYNDFFDEIYNLSPVPVNHDLLCDFGDAFGYTSSEGLVDIEFDALDGGVKVNGMKTPAFAIRFVSKNSGRTRFPELVM